MLQGLSKLMLNDSLEKLEVISILEEINHDIETRVDLQEEKTCSSVAKVLYAMNDLKTAKEYINGTFSKYHIPITFLTHKALFKIACIRLNELDIETIWKDLSEDADQLHIEVLSWKLLAYAHLYKFEPIFDIIEILEEEVRLSILSKCGYLIRKNLQEVQDVENLHRFDRLCVSKKISSFS
jgi:hypothetical protein